ncbi:MAG: cupin domain-containing protein [Chromatiaceae bacterium]|jgi:mannose-6-phosphate isomerase-like protein (cupin superfamily)|nr:cupin domain-containing protein [Chromatiaceae bacterium]
MNENNWLLFKLSDLLAKVEPGSVRFHEFLRTPSLSCSVYHIPAGSKEMESAHVEDELYLVLDGRGRLRVEGEDQAVEKGTLMYVHAACDHTFFDVEEDLTVIAFFGACAPQKRVFWDGN